MAAVAQSLAGRAAPASDYPMLGGDVDAEGEEDAEADFDDDVQPSAVVTHADKSDGDVQVESEEEDDASEALVDISKRAKKINARRIKENDIEAALDDDVSEAEASSAEDEDESEKSSSDEESAAPPEWEAGSDGGEDGSIEVANRNNCM